MHQVFSVTVVRFSQSFKNAQLKNKPSHRSFHWPWHTGFLFSFFKVLDFKLYYRKVSSEKSSLTPFTKLVTPFSTLKMF